MIGKIPTYGQRDISVVFVQKYLCHLCMWKFSLLEQGKHL
jgi:hypothetical protein